MAPSLGTPVALKPQRPVPFPAPALTPPTLADLPALQRSAQRILGCPDLAQDAAQEALIALWRAPVPPANPRAWLFKATVLRALHLLRSESRRSTHECRAASECSLSAEPVDLESAELQLRVRAAVSELPERFRVPLELYTFHGLDYRAIAKREGVPLGTVRSRIRRARQRLQVLLEGAA